jgi:hypothetical protein
VHDGGNLSELWHQHFGHLHYGALPLLGDMVQGLSDFKIEKIGVCKGCALEKHLETAFPSNEKKSREFLDLIHSNVSRSMPSSSITGSLCYVSFIDDYLCKT